MRDPIGPSRTLLALALAAALSAGCGTGTPPGGPPGDPDAFGATAVRLAELVNASRVEGRDCGTRGAFATTHPLALEARLVSAAQLHSEDMRAHDFMSHVGSDGSTLAERIEREGYAWAAAGENVARGYATPEAVVAGWLGSDGHCANLMRPEFTELGAGEDGRHWTLVFARPR